MKKTQEPTKLPTLNPGTAGQLSPTGIVEAMAAGATLTGAILVDGRKPSLLVPEGYKTIELPREDFAPVPDHIRQRVELHDQASFIGYVKLYQNVATRLFAKVTDSGASLSAVFDYHEAGREGKAGRAVHTAVYPCPLSLEWKTWMGQNGKAQSQEDFAEFIDANARDVKSPDSASLLELAMNFESKSQVNFQSDIRRSGNGGRVLKYTETVEAGRSAAPGAGEIKIPEALSLLIPVFEAGKAFPLEARLEWRASNGRLAVTYHLRRPQETMRLAINTLRAEIAADTGIEVLSGALTGGTGI